MSIKKLVTYLELGFLGFGLVVLLLSSLGRQQIVTESVPETVQEPAMESAQQPVVEVVQSPAPKPNEPQEVIAGEEEVIKLYDLRTEADNDEPLPVAETDLTKLDSTEPEAAKSKIAKPKIEKPEFDKDGIVILYSTGIKISPADFSKKKADTAASIDTGADTVFSQHSVRENMKVREKWTGDLNQMRKRRVVRVLVPFSRTFFFLDKGRKRGLIYEGLMEYEKFLNKQVKGDKHLPVQVMVVPTSRDRLFSDLNAGIGDIVAANLTITPKRKALVEFCNPMLTDVREIIVTGAKAGTLKSIFDLAGKSIMVRKSSSYYESLLTLNKTLQSIGKKPVTITFADEYLEDEDLLEMVNAGLVPMIVIDSHKGEFWAKIFKGIRLHPDIKLRTDGEIAWAIRRNSPQLKKSINKFVKGVKKGSLMGNILFERYLQNTKYIHHGLSESSMKQYKQTVKLFEKYAEKYDFPYLLLVALAYQESGLDQKKRSHAGAIGIMQILPSTAADPNVGIKNINKMENNIHAGTRYLRFMADRYFSDPDLTPLNRDLFTLAAYNAGPARVKKLREEAKRRGFDANVWFNNVEAVAAARIGRETVTYVRNIYKYFIAYEYITQREQKKKIGKSILESHYKNK